jgi:outer membrane lipoprotein SlyB
MRAGIWTARILPAAVLAAVLTLGASLLTPPPAAGQAGALQRIQYGEIVSAERVQIERARTGKGAAVGSTVGTVAGAVLANRRDSWVGGLVGGLIGGAIGHAADQKQRYRPGWELIIRLDGGEEAAIQLPREAGSFREGDRVRLMSGPRGTQVTRVAE